ncbi:MAG: hypothetical protein LUO95_05480 [Methylococcaceae bacterium]|nr:hypothetical protein [Methylococcaceae bacterium]MDD1607188.1 hypothetical protein [Methylococcaceae bacterium]MDD1610052.1 hypothetical protein [Methylococcaceae bacterium]MDD1617305.1 hypothetical protein [Methylococcaceae bacterium]OYV15628.1 MAG: hypothetical protein CG439_2452 [Methylococcaceae bacterium NSP1-2]
MLDTFMNSEFRVRISTALLLIALLLLPFAALWIAPPYFPSQPVLLHNTFGWLYFGASPNLFAASFLVAFISAVALSFRRQWRAVVQCLTEMGVCFICVLFFIPTY